MLSIEEIKLLIEKLERAKHTDFQKLIDTSLRTLKDIEKAVDANNREKINRLAKTNEWWDKDLDQKKDWPIVDDLLATKIKTKIKQFSRTADDNMLEIGPGWGMFSNQFTAWELNYFVDINPRTERHVRRQFRGPHQKKLKFHLTKQTDCKTIPTGSCNFVFSWDTFVYFTQSHIQQYLKDIYRVLIPGGYGFINYADCHWDHDLKEAERGYFNYNTKTLMTEMLESVGYQVVEMNNFEPGANYAIFRKPGKQNSAVHNISEIELD